MDGPTMGSVSEGLSRTWAGFASAWLGNGLSRSAGQSQPWACLAMFEPGHVLARTWAFLPLNGGHGRAKRGLVQQWACPNVGRSLFGLSRPWSGQAMGCPVHSLAPPLARLTMGGPCHGWPGNGLARPAFPLPGLAVGWPDVGLGRP
jgi:hypothetical protein